MARTRRNEELIRIEEKHATYYAVAYTSFLEARRLARERAVYRRSVAAQGREWTEDDEDEISVTKAKEERSTIAAVIFSALSLEAFINYYAITAGEFAEENYFYKYFERIPAVSKWLIFPWLVVGETFSKQTLQLLTGLFRTRNQLVHFKKKPARSRVQKGRLGSKDVLNAVRTVHKAVTELSGLDASVSTRWMSEVEKAPS